MRFFSVLLIIAVVMGAVWMSENAPITSAQTPGFQNTPRPSGIDAILGGMSAESTAQAARGTAAAYYAVGTAQAAEVTAQAEERSLQATQEAARVIQAAESTAQAHYWQIIAWTATADSAAATAQAVATAQAWTYTQTAVVSDARSTEAAAAYIASTLRRNDERQALTNQVLAWLPYAALGIAVLAILGLIVIASIKYWKRPQAIHHDPNGALPMLVDNNGHYLEPNRLPAALVRLLPSGAAAPALAGEEATERAVARHQTVQLAAQTRGGPSAPAPRAPFEAPAPAPQRNYRVFADGNPPPELPPGVIQVLDGAWKETAL